MNEYPRAAKWLYETLTNPPITGVGANVYEDDAPEAVTDSSTVWITFETLDNGSDLRTDVGSYRVFTEFVFQVAAFMRGRSTQALKDIADEIDSRLDRASAAIDDAIVLACERTGPVQEPYLKQGVEYRALGGVFNLTIQPSA